MRKVCLMAGAPDEPATRDWDAICAGPSIEGFFAVLFREVAHRPMPALTNESETEDAEVRVRTGWYGDRALGIEVSVVEILESSMFDVRCRWETHGLPGMKATWAYALEYAGQLGHVAYRHCKLECEFDSENDEVQFVRVWQKEIGKTPRFEPA